MGADRSCPRSRLVPEQTHKQTPSLPQPPWSRDGERGLGNAPPDSQQSRQLQVSSPSVPGLTEGTSAHCTDLGDPLKLGDPGIPQSQSHRAPQRESRNHRTIPGRGRPHKSGELLARLLQGTWQSSALTRRWWSLEFADKVPLRAGSGLQLRAQNPTPYPGSPGPGRPPKLYADSLSTSRAGEQPELSKASGDRPPLPKCENYFWAVGQGRGPFTTQCPGSAGDVGESPTKTKARARCPSAGRRFVITVEGVLEVSCSKQLIAFHTHYVVR